MDTITKIAKLEIESKIKLNTKEAMKKNKQMQILRGEIHELNSESKELEKQLKQMEFNEYSDNSIKDFLNNNPNYKYVGKTDGKEKDIENNMFIKCDKDNIFLDIFISETGIGQVIKAKCSKCGHIVNLTNYSNW